MEVPITQFRRKIFDLVNQAMAGSEVWVTHKGQRFRIAPENQPASRLSRITPMEILASEAPDLNDPVLKAEMLAEMEKAWERDWTIL
jgi:antitoxin (DNA-binding transcriptional repressor) of toxin-antitoxin stability system